MAATNSAGDAILLKYLVTAGCLTNADAATALAAAAVEPASADETSHTALECAAAKGFVDEEDVAHLLADRLHLDYANPAGSSFDPDVAALVKEDVATRYQMVPLRLDGAVLVLASANPLDRDAIRAVEFATGKRVRCAVATPTAIRDAVRHLYHLEESLAVYLEGVKDHDGGLIVPLKDDDGDLGVTSDGSELPPIIKLFNLILVGGIRAGASDIHIEPGPAVVQVRYRIDGLLEESSRLPKWVAAPLVARCKVMSKLDITERRIPQDGHISIRYRKAKIDLRVSSLPTQHGEKLAIRILNPQSGRGGLEKLALSARDQGCVAAAIRRPEGIVLVTGPTGSGKSTTLYAMLNEIATSTRNIITIENPIEYQVPGINQVEVNEKQGLTFAQTLRSILRQDPDVIMVGEIRDAETAQIALRAAQTGHLVLSTLHTNDTVATVTRLIDLGVEPAMLGGALNLVVAQRLVRKVCAECAEPDSPTEADCKQLGLPEKGEYRRGRGCDACRGTGYSGRMAVVEVLDVSRKLSRLIEARAADSALHEQGLRDGMLTLGECAADKVRDGLTTAEEVLRVIDTMSPKELCQSCHAPVEAGFKVCPFCLAPLRLECSQCHQLLQAGWKACPFCMAGVSTPSAPLEEPPAEAPRRAEAEAVPVSAPAAAAVAVAVAEPAPQYRILVVDDAADMRRLITVSLERAGLGIKVIPAENGVEGLALALAERPDVIILDVMMPLMDGFEVCRRLRADVRTTFIPVLMLTTLGDLVHREKGFLSGTDDYITKPFNRLDLIDRMRRMLHRNYGEADSWSVAPDQSAANSAA